MFRSDLSDARDSVRRIDWPGWAALAWLLVMGSLYVRMVVIERGGKAAQALSALTGRADAASATSMPRAAR